VHDGLLEIARREPKRCRVVDAAADIDAVEAAVVAAVKDALNLDLSS
jgi:thymidylate kinase